MERSGIRENLDFGLMACIPAREVFVQLLNQGFPDTAGGDEALFCYWRIFNHRNTRS
jgi:hypothetical protein